MQNKVNWLWVLYTPGAGGKFLCTLCQLCEKVDTWDHALHTSTDQYLQTKLLMPLTQHILHEPRFPYDLSYFTRQLPMTRGDGMTKEESVKKFYEHNPEQTFDSNKYISLQWHKPYLPEWFDGKVITLVNDDASFDWLKKRRDGAFYEWNGNEVTHKRFHPDYIPGKKLAKKYFDTTNVFEKFDNKQDFYKKYFYEDVEVQGLIEPITEYKDRQKINVSDLLFKNTKTLVEPICDFIQSKIDMDKASYIHDKWKKMNTKLLDDY